MRLEGTVELSLGRSTGQKLNYGRMDRDAPTMRVGHEGSKYQPLVFAYRP